MFRSSKGAIKREQKKSLFFRELSVFVQKISETEKSVANVFISRVDLSDDCGILYIFFTSLQEPSQKYFDEALDFLKLYKPSMRKALAQTLQGRYTPELVFMFDDKFEKVRRVNELLDKVHEDLEEAE